MTVVAKIEQLKFWHRANTGVEAREVLLPADVADRLEAEISGFIVRDPRSNQWTLCGLDVIPLEPGRCLAVA